MTAPNTMGETEEEKQARLLREQGQADSSGSSSGSGAPAGSSSAPGSSGASPNGGSPTPSLPTGTPMATSSSLPTGFAPPPPPPPPPPPDVAALTGKVIDFTSDWMSNPNPYEGAAATAARTASEANLSQAQKDQERQILEWAQGRGLTGSSYEGDQRVQLAGTMQRARQDFNAQLLDKIAAADAASRQGAGTLGLNTLQQITNTGTDAAKLAEQAREFNTTAGISQQDIDLKAQQLQVDAMMQGRTLDLQAARDQATKELAQAQMAQSGSQFTQQLAATTGLSQQEIDLKAQQLVQDAAAQGRTLDLQAARDQVAAQATAAQTGIAQQEVELKAQQLVQDAATQGRTLDLQAARDQATKEIEAAKLTQQGTQFTAQLGISQQDLDLRTSQLQQQAALEGRTLDVTQARDAATKEYQFAALAQQGTVAQADLDLRAQQLVQQAQLEGRSLTLQEAQAATQKEVQLGQLGISQQEVDQRARQIANDAAASGRTLDLQQARDQASVALETEKMQLQATLAGNELAQQESQFAKTMGLNQQEFMLKSQTAAQQYGEQVATRLQQDQQWRTTLQSQNAQAAVDAGLRQQALQLQAQGMTMDAAYKQAALQQESALTLSAQELQRQGLSQDQAYKMAALNQDARFRQDANRLTELGLTQTDAYRYAEIALNDRQLKQQNDQFTASQDFQKWYAEQQLGIVSPADAAAAAAKAAADAAAAKAAADAAAAAGTGTGGGGGGGTPPGDQTGDGGVVGGDDPNNNRMQPNMYAPPVPIPPAPTTTMGTTLQQVPPDALTAPPPSTQPANNALPFDPNDQQAVLRWLQQSYQQ